MKNKGLSLLEILIATVILALVVTGLTNIFITGKRYVLHNRSRMTAGELGKYFLDPLYLQVMQSDWSVADYTATNPLSLGADKPGNTESSGLDRPYNPTYNVTTVPDPSLPADNQMRKVKVLVTWNEPTG